MVQLGPLRVVCAAGSSGDSDNTYLGLAGQPGKAPGFSAISLHWCAGNVNWFNWLLLPAKST